MDRISASKRSGDVCGTLRNAAKYWRAVKRMLQDYLLKHGRKRFERLCSYRIIRLCHKSRCKRGGKTLTRLLIMGNFWGLMKRNLFKSLQDVQYINIAKHLIALKRMKKIIWSRVSSKFPHRIHLNELIWEQIDAYPDIVCITCPEGMGLKISIRLNSSAWKCRQVTSIKWKKDVCWF